MDGYPSESKQGGHGGLTESLCKNIDEVVKICTGCCVYTGLLCSVHCGLVKLVTRQSCGCRCNCYGSLTIIPICEIEAVTICN